MKFSLLASMLLEDNALWGLLMCNDALDVSCYLVDVLVKPASCWGARWGKQGTP